MENNFIKVKGLKLDFLNNLRINRAIKLRYNLMFRNTRTLMF